MVGGFRGMQFFPEVLPGIFLGYVLYAGRIWKGDIMVADIEELEQTDASELHARWLNVKGSVQISEGDQDLRTSTLIRDNPDRGEEQDILLQPHDNTH